MTFWSFTAYFTAVFCYLFSNTLVFANNSFFDESSDFASLVSPQANSVLIVSGVDYSSGYYGLKRKAEILSIPMVFKYRHDNWDFGLTFSYFFFIMKHFDTNDIN